MITRYREYLGFLDNKLEQMFDEQKDFIKCKKGCAYCCKEGEFPLSELEYVYLMFYFNNLEDEIKDKINENIQTLLTNSREKLYKCPFLIDNVCSVYPARSIICRTFGLIFYDKKNKQKVPFCVDLGLNYANMNEKNDENEELTPQNTPKAYNIERTVLRSSKVESLYDINFGEDMPLIDFLREDFSSP